MHKSSTVRARIEPKLKKEVETLFHKLGLSVTDAISIFYKQVKLKHGIPICQHMFRLIYDFYVFPAMEPLSIISQ